MTGMNVNLHAAARGPWARLDVRIKLLASVSALVAAIGSHRMAVPAIVLTAAAAGWFVSGLPARALVRRMAGPVLLAAVLVVVRTFTLGQTPLFAAGRFVAYREGVVDGSLLGVRVIGGVAAVLLLWATSPGHGIFAALRWLGLPRTFVNLAMLMHRYVFVLFEHASCGRDAQRVRLGYATFPRTIRSASSLAGLVLLRSIDQAERTHEAMVARGYTGRFPLPALPALRATQRLAAWLPVAGAIGLLAAQRWWI